MTLDTFEHLSQVFGAESVALVGASDKAGSFGRLFLEGLQHMGCQRIYPVNPRREEILGVRAFASISAIPEGIDLAILLTPTDSVLGLVKECAQKGVKGVVIFAAGFGETGPEGKDCERELARLARESSMRIIGPNCLGFYNPKAGILTFPQALIEGMPKESGTVGGFSQSGSFMDYLVWSLASKGVKFSTIVSCGNECDLGSEEYLEYFGKDETTETIVAYMEGVRDGRRFFEVAREVASKKPVILWKGGASEQGAKAAASHTGALAGSADMWNAMFGQTGIVNVTCMQEVVDCTLAFHYLPLPKGRRIAVITGHGGTGVGTADNCLALGLELPRLSHKTSSRLKEMLPGVGTSIGNPVDVGVASLLNPSLYGEAIRIVAEDENFDMILANTSPVRACEESIIMAAKDVPLPLAISIFALPELVPDEYRLFAESGIPAYPDPKQAVYAFSRMVEYQSFLTGTNAVQSESRSDE